MTQLTIDDIIARISRRHRDLVVDRNDMIEWALEAMEDGMEYGSFEEVQGLDLPLVGDRASLPVNTYRVIAVYGNSGRCDNKDFVVKKSCIILPEGTTQAKADLLLFPVDESMSPLIDGSFAPVVEAYCKMSLLTDGWAKGTVRSDVYELARHDYQAAQHRHRSSYRGVTSAEMSKWGRIMRASIIMPRR